VVGEILHGKISPRVVSPPQMLEAFPATLT